MATFTYKAVRQNGEKYEGTVEAADRFAVYNEVRHEGGTVVSVSEKGGTFSLPGLLHKLNEQFSTVKTSDRIAMLRNLGAMLSAGLSISRALGILERQARNPKLKSALAAIELDVRGGSSFHDAVAKFPGIFSNLAIAMIRAGEESGGLVEALRVITVQMDRAYQLTKKVRGALIYPGIVISAMVVVGVLMLLYVVPTLTATFTELNVELPRSTQLIIGVSDFLVNYTIVALLGILIIIASVYLGLRTGRGKKLWHYVLLKIPIIGTIVREVNAARTARTLSSLLSAGVSVIQSLTITEEVLQNVYFKRVTHEAAQQIEKGGQISEVFIKASTLYPVIFGEMVAVGEETGKLSELFEQVATFYEGEVEQKTKDMSTVIEPFLMIVIGATVGFFAVSMISPIYSLSSAI